MEITVNREETRQMKQYEPLKLSVSIVFTVDDKSTNRDIETYIADASGSLRKAILAEFEKESLLRLEEIKR